MTCERFWRMVSPRPSAGCWEWTGGKDTNGYGRTWNGTRSEGTHRLAWQFTYGEIPKGFFICHHCDNPPCCNPRHLFLGTAQDNMQDAWHKGRYEREDGADSPLLADAPRYRAFRLAGGTIAQWRQQHEWEWTRARRRKARTHDADTFGLFDPPEEKNEE